jgi:hypothetical protein
MFEYLNGLMEKNKELEIPAFDLLVYKDGKQVYRYQHGVIDFEGTPVSDKTLYNLYSCSKFITCVTALTLLENGKFTLEDDLAMYIPAFKDMQVNANGVICRAQNPIKLKHLFTMTSGLDYDLCHKGIKECIVDTDGRCPTVESMKYIAIHFCGRSNIERTDMTPYTANEYLAPSSSTQKRTIREAAQDTERSKICIKQPRYSIATPIADKTAHTVIFFVFLIYQHPVPVQLQQQSIHIIPIQISHTEHPPTGAPAGRRPSNPAALLRSLCRASRYSGFCASMAQAAS